MASAIGNIIFSAANRLNALATTIIKMAPRMLDYAVSAIVLLTNAWLSYLSMISVIVTLLGNYVKRFITIIERTVLGAVARVVEQLCRILLRLGQPTNAITYIGSLVNSLITLISTFMKNAVNEIVDMTTGMLSRVISWVKTIMNPLVNRKPGSSEKIPRVPERPKKDASKGPDQEDPIEIQPVM